MKVYSKQCVIHLPFADVDIEFEDAELMEKVKKLENGDRSELLDFDIPVTGDIAFSKKILVASILILKSFSAFEQFSKGLGSIDQAFKDVANLECIKFFLSRQQHDLMLNDFISVINFKNDAEKHSNQWTIINNIALEVKLFFASVANNNISGFGLNDLLFLFTGMERIPPFGLEKKIDIEFVEGDEPRISTCSCSVTLSVTNAVKMLEMTLKYGGGLGVV